MAIHDETHRRERKGRRLMKMTAMAPMQKPQSDQSCLLNDHFSRVPGLDARRLCSPAIVGTLRGQVLWLLLFVAPMAALAQSPDSHMAAQAPFPTPPAAIASTTVTAQALLDAFRGNQQRQARFILNYEIQLDQDWQIRDPNYAGHSGKHACHNSGELRVDGTCHFRRDSEWTESTNKSVARPKDKPMERM